MPDSVPDKITVDGAGLRARANPGSRVVVGLGAVTQPAVGWRPHRAWRRTWSRTAASAAGIHAAAGLRSGERRMAVRLPFTGRVMRRQEERMARPGHADRDDLLRWAATVPARTEFPRLIRRLALETVQLGFPARTGSSRGCAPASKRPPPATARHPTRPSSSASKRSSTACKPRSADLLLFLPEPRCRRARAAAGRYPRQVPRLGGTAHRQRRPAGGGLPGGGHRTASRPVLHRGELRADGDRELRPGCDRG